MYHHRIYAITLPDDYSEEYGFSVGDGGIIYYKSNESIFWSGYTTDLQIQYRLTFMQECSSVLVVSGAQGTEIVTALAHFSLNNVQNVTYWCGTHLGTAQAEVFYYNVEDYTATSVVTLDSEIVYIFETQVSLAVSTLTKLIMLPDKQIGTKLRKNTRHGGCEYLDRVMACRPSLKVFVYDKSAYQVVKTIALKESVPQLDTQYCVGEREADLGILTQLKDNILVSFYRGQCIIIDIEQPCALEYICLGVDAQFVNARAFWRTDRAINLFEVLQGPREEQNESVTYESSVATDSRAFYGVIQEDAESTPVVVSPPTSVQSAVPAGGDAYQAPEAPKQLKPYKYQQIAEAPRPRPQFVYEAFSVLAPVAEDDVQHSILEYVPHFKFRKYTAPQNEQPLNYFFPFLPQYAVDCAGNSLAALSSQLAQNYFILSQTPQIAQISLSELNLSTYAQLDSLTVRKLQKWLSRDAPRAVQLLQQASTLDPLYAHVRQMLSTLASKAIFSLCFARDFVARQPLRKRCLYDIFEVTLPPEDLCDHVRAQMQALGPLLQPFPRALVALIFRIPELIYSRDCRILSPEQREFVELLGDGAARVQKLNLTLAQAQDYCAGKQDNQLIAAVYYLFCGAKRLFGDYLDSWISMYLLPYLENVEAHARFLFLSVFYAFIDVRVQTIAKCRLALEIGAEVVLKEQTARYLLHVTGSGFDADIQYFLNGAVQHTNLNITLLQLLKQTNYLQIFAYYFAERGEIDGSLELSSDADTRYYIYKKLLETADSKEVVRKFFASLAPDRIAYYVEAAVGWVESDFLYDFLMRREYLSVRVVSLLARGK